MEPTGAEKRLFISYSHQDREWLQRLQVCLKPHFSDAEVSVWDDTQIPSGSIWWDEIDRALQGATAAVLLLSSDFLASDFIMNQEWPRLKKAAAERGLRILPVPVRSSAVGETEIGEFQALLDTGQPIDHFEKADQDHLLVKVARKIRDAMSQKVIVTSTPGGWLPLRSFEIMPDLAASAVDAEGRLWVTNGQQVKVFRLDHEQPLHRWVLPNRRWKCFLESIWRGGLMIADWDGAIYGVNDQHRQAVFHPAGHDSLPVHLLAAGPAGHLAAAAWDGTIRRWNADGQAAGAPFAAASLPTHLAVLDDGDVLLADQSNRLLIFDREGRERWSWSAGEPPRALWAYTNAGVRHVVAILRQRLVRIDAGGEVQQQLLGAPIVSFSRRVGDGDEWVVFAEEGGAIEWVSLSPLQLLRDNSVPGGTAIRQIVAVPVQESARHLATAVGLSDDGRLFVLSERRIEWYDEPKGIERLLLAGEGRFLLLLSGPRFGLYRNPVLRGTCCRMQIAEVAGKLAAGGFTRLMVRVANTGTIPIHRLTAEVHADGDIVDRSKNSRAVSLPVAPGAGVDLEFSIRARVTGDSVPLTLRLEMSDEGGPPSVTQELRFDVESR